MSGYLHPFGSTLPEDGSIGRGYALISNNKRAEFRVTYNGNLELIVDGKRLWSVDGKNVSYVIMQRDGNCAAYTAPNTAAVWATGTNGNEHPYKLLCQDDGNLVVYAKGSKSVWATNTVVIH
ncbi:hypothetical protein L218DRAFT_587118 [Marasmius fiardii PR-910]|nr:hypothetical protein L218DRAFT_587118 [Marasmius fiardii PR-910]